MFKLKLAIVLTLLSAMLTAQNNDSAAIAAANARIDSLKSQTGSLNDSLATVTQLINNIGLTTYIADEDAIAWFNRNRDSIYLSSSYSLLKCRSCEENVAKKSKARLQVIKQNRNAFSLFTFWVSLILFVLMWYYGIKLFIKSNLCKDGGTLPVTDRPYSYSRVQLFFWTMIIFSLYLYFFAFTGILLPVNSTVVLLLGGGLLVYSAGKIVDFRKAPAPAAGDGVAHKTEGLFLDILSDNEGVTIHRFQSLVFNIIYGVGFVLMFFKNVNQCLYPFPEFSNWQFALLGISSATYVGLKASEGKAPVQNQSA